MPTEENVRNSALKEISLMNKKTGDELDEAGQDRIEPLFTYLSPRVPYEVTQLASVAVTREIIIGLSLRNILS